MSDWQVPIFENAKIECTKESAWIEIHLVDGSVIVRTGNSLRDKPITLTKPGSDNLRTAFNMFFNSPTSVAFTIARGSKGKAASAEIPDTVLELAEEQLDVSPLLWGLPPKTYQFKLYKVRQLEVEKSESADFSLSHGSQKNEHVKTSTLAPGLYEVVFVDDQDEPLGLNSWVLVVHENNFEYASKSWNETKRNILKNSSTSSSTNNANRIILRACLSALAQELDSKKH